MQTRRESNTVDLVRKSGWIMGWIMGWIDACTAGYSPEYVHVQLCTHVLCNVRTDVRHTCTHGEESLLFVTLHEVPRTPIERFDPSAWRQNCMIGRRKSGVDVDLVVAPIPGLRAGLTVSASAGSGQTGK